MPRISREGDDPDFACRGIGKAASGRGFLVSGCETGATRSGSHDLFVAGCGVLGWFRLTGGTCDSVTYRCDSLDCSVARLAIQQGLGILSERRVGTYPAYPFNPSSPRAVVALPLPFFYLFGRLLRRGREVSAIWRFSASVPENLAELACGWFAAGLWTVSVFFAGANAFIHAASRSLMRRSALPMNFAGS